MRWYESTLYQQTEGVNMLGLILQKLIEYIPVFFILVLIANLVRFI
jgi:hypothetical protein